MAFLILLIIVNALALGIAWSWFLIGGPHFRRGREFDPMIVGRKVFSVERFLFGGTAVVLGISWLMASVYFIATRTFVASYWELATHVGLQLAGAVTLIAAGVGVYNYWRVTRPLFFAAIALLLASMFFAVLVYGPEYYQESMNIYVTGAFLLFGICSFISGFYLLEHLARSSEEERTTQKR